MFRPLAHVIVPDRSEAILAGFLAMIPPHCQVVRTGTITQVPAQTLVKGDIVLIRMGDKTPADMIIFAATDLKVDNSSLTGESEPQERMPDLKGGSKVSAVEAKNIVFNSTMVVSGEGWGGACDVVPQHSIYANQHLLVVVRTGDNTFIGQIAHLTGGESGNRSPLAVEIDHFVHIISGIAITTASK